MQLDFIRLDVEHFRTIGKRVNLDLGERGNGLHYLRGVNKLNPHLGPNGVGKTSLWHALSWCLYGRTPNSLRGPDIKPWAKSKQSNVGLALLADGKKHVVTRMTPNVITLDGKESTQDAIDRLIKLPFNVFCNTIMLAQGQPLFFDLQPQQKMRLLGDVLPLERWDTRAKRATAAVAEYDKELTELSVAKAGSEGRLQQLTSDLALHKQASEKWEQARTSDALASEVELRTLEKDLAHATSARDEANLVLDGALTELRPLEKQLRDLNIKYQHALSLSFTLRDTINNNGKCPTCGQPLKGKAAARKHAGAELKKVSRNINALLAQIKPLENAQKEFYNRADEATSGLDHLNERVGRLSAQVKAIKETSNRREQNPHKLNLQHAKRERERLKDEIAELEKKMRLMLRMQERVRFWTKGFKEVRLYEVAEVLEELDLVTNSMLDDVGLVGWQVVYAVEKETKSGTTQRGLNVSILSPENKKPVRWECWSGGEGQRLRLIGSLALSEVLLNYAGVTPTLEVLDEPVKFLSTEGVNDLVDYLSDRAHRLQRQVWLTSHIVLESARFDSVLTVVRDQNGSRLRAQ